MIQLKSEDGVFNLRAAGILIRDDKVLIHHWKPDGFYAFPGGRVEMFEDTESTLIREFKEEIEADIRVVRLLWVNEAFFEHEGDRYHELCFYYLIELCDPAQLPQGDVFQHTELDGSWMEFRWVPLTSIQTYDLVPEFVRDRLDALPTQIEKRVARELEDTCQTH